MLKTLVLVAAFSVSIVAQADQLKIFKSTGQFTTTTISAENIKGVTLKLTENITRTDCNKRSIVLNQALADGGGQGFYDLYFLSAGTIHTEANCPLKTPVEETISSKEFFISSLTNRSLKGALVVSLIYSSDYTLEVTEVPND